MSLAYCVLLFLVSSVSSGFLYGVLNTDQTYIQSDYNAGIRFAQFDFGWDSWQPTQTSTNTDYVTSMKNKVATYRNQGFKIAISVGLQYPPQWVLNLTDGQLVDQFGNTSGTPNYEFNANVRSFAASYIKDVVTTIGSVDYYRVGLSDSGEMLIGHTGNSNNNWWAFDRLAQGKATGLPPGVSVCPLPGWIPGTSTFEGKAITTEQVQTWYNWYFNALTNGHAWEISSYRNAGYEGLIQLVAPGIGATPTTYNKRIAANLTDVSYDGYYTMNTGAVWWQTFANLPNRTNTVLDISSVYDSSGNPRGNHCTSTDYTVPLNQADPSVSSWSSTRWMAYLVHNYSMPLVGENPGQNSADDMQNVFSLAYSCNLTGIMWAFDSQLYDNKYATISDYTQIIAKGPNQ